MQVKSRHQLSRINWPLYKKLKDSGLLDELFPKLHKGRWTFEECRDEAIKYKTRDAWYKGHKKSYNAASGNGWLNEFDFHFGKRRCKVGAYTKDECIKIAKNFETKQQWMKSNGGSAQAAMKNGWYEECTKHMVSGNRINAKSVINMNTRKIYNSATEASLALRKARNAISNAIKNNTKVAGAYWEYV